MSTSDNAPDTTISPLIQSFFDLRITADEVRVPLEGFLALPPEIRNKIYIYALISPSRLDRHHTFSCPWWPRIHTQHERPPFLATQTKWDADKMRSVRQYGCACAKRSLGLLQTNRQVHREAACIFWSGNVFVWPTWWEFAHDTSDLRAEYRELIRQVVIMNHLTEPNTSIRLDFWTALWACKGLHRLELPIEYPTQYPQMFVTLRKNLLYLKEVSLNETVAYDLLPREERVNPGAWLPDWRPDMELRRTQLIFRVLQTFTPSQFTSLLMVGLIVRQFLTNFVPDCRFAIKMELLGQPGNIAFDRHAELQDASIPGDLNDRNNTRVLTLRDGTSTTVHVYCLPLSNATRAANEREWKEEASRRNTTQKPALSKEQMLARVEEEKERANEDERKQEG